MNKNYKWYHRMMFIMGFLLLAAVTIYTIVSYGNIESDVPTHFNVLGEADAFGNKSSLIMLLIMGWVLFVGLAVIGSVPAVWNTGVEVTEKNREKVYSILRTMLCVLTFAIAAFFSYTVFFAVKGMSLPTVATPAFLIVVFGTIIISIVRLVRNR